MRRVVVAARGVMLGTSALRRAAGKSDVADAVMKGDTRRASHAARSRKPTSTPRRSTARRRCTGPSTATISRRADLLLRAGANVDAANREGMTPLAMASLYGNAPMIERLLKAGADAKQRRPERRDDADARGAQRQSGGDQAARRGRRGREREGNAARHDRADVGGGAAASRSGQGAARARRRLTRQIGSGRPAAQLHGAARQHRGGQGRRSGATRRRAAGRTYEEQLEFEVGAAARRSTIGVPRRRVQTPAARATSRPHGRAGAQAAGAPRRRAAARSGGGRAPPAGRPTRRRRGRGDATTPTSIVAGLVGTGGGGLTALVFAAREGDLESAKPLLDAGADVNQTTEYGWTPLLTATNNRHYKLGACLIDRGADANIANKGGWTPLYLATDNRNIEGGDYPVPKPDMDHLEFIKLLLDHGADPERARRRTTR